MTLDDQERPQRLPASLSRWPLSLLAFLILCALLFVAGIPAWRVAKWVGHKGLLLTFKVRDASSGAPLANAEVVIFRGYADNPGWTPEPDMLDAETIGVLTGVDGTACMPCAFRSTGTSCLYFETGAVNIGERFVRIAADGYKPDVFRLASRIGESRDIHDEQPITIDVQMKR